MLDRRQFGTFFAAGAAISTTGKLAATENPAASKGNTRVDELRSANLPDPVEVSIYTPPGYDARSPRRYPLLLLLHGGNGSEQDMLRFTDAIEREIVGGRLPPMVIASPGAGRSFYMDFQDGSQLWESFILSELLPYLRQSLSVRQERSATMIGGWSMGGMGSLRIAFKHPDIFAAVAAIEPAIEPALFYGDIGGNVRFWRSEDVMRTIFGDPVDTNYWEANNPATIAARDPERLLDLAIYFEVGDQDMLHLYEGAEFLHRILFDAGLAHEFRLVHGAEHVGPSLEPRLLDALGFLGRQIDPPDWIDSTVEQFRALMDEQKKAAGVPVAPRDPRRLKQI